MNIMQSYKRAEAKAISLAKASEKAIAVLDKANGALDTERQRCAKYMARHVHDGKFAAFWRSVY
jgi:hypothetical protein